MNMKNTSYAQNYSAFMGSYVTGMTSAEGVAVAISKLAAEFVSLNIELVAAERALSLVAEANESRMDESGKVLSSAKAKVFTDASPEANDVTELKAHKENIRVLVAALESLQRGIMDAPKVTT